MTISGTKPNGGTTPTWATDGGTRSAASGGQQATGWTNGQRPAFNVMNWLQGLFADFIDYLVGATDDLESSKLENTTDTLTGTLTVTGDLLVGDDIVLSGGVSLEPSGSADLSLVTIGGAFHPAANGGDLGKSALRWDAFLQEVNVAGEMQIVGRILCSDIVAADNFEPTDTPASTSAEISGMTRWGMVRVSGNISFDGVGGVAVESGVNIASVAIENDGTSDTWLRVNFSGPWGGLDPIIVATVGGPAADARYTAVELFSKRSTAEAYFQIITNSGVRVDLGGATAADLRLQFMMLADHLSF